MSAKGDPQTNVRDGQMYPVKLAKVLARQVSAAASAAGWTINRWITEAIKEKLAK
jgi:predicted HicB family RNase H-like nuclease